MLVIEHNANGTTTVKIKKDWHPGRISLAYIPKQRVRYSQQEFIIQTALLRKPS